MKKAILMIPQADNQGRAFEAATIEAIKQGFLSIAGGYTESNCAGAWIDKASGKVFVDNNSRFEIIVDDKGLESLKLFAKTICRELRQACIYFESFEVNCDFIEAQQKGA